MENKEIKLNNIKIALLAFLFVVMFSFAYFLLYSPIKVNDSQLLTITMIFSALVVSIPLYVFDNAEEKEIKPERIKKKSKRHG